MHPYFNLVINFFSFNIFSINVFNCFACCCTFHNRVCGTLRYEIIFAFTFNELLASSAQPSPPPLLLPYPLLAFMISCSVISYKWLDRSIDNGHVQHASVVPHAANTLGNTMRCTVLWFSVPQSVNNRA